MAHTFTLPKVRAIVNQMVECPIKGHEDEKGLRQNSLQTLACQKYIKKQ